MNALATLKNDTGALTWVVTTCPICGGEHTHGAGADPARVSEYLGHRVSHCTTAGYTLVSP